MKSEQETFALKLKAALDDYCSKLGVTTSRFLQTIGLTNSVSGHIAHARGMSSPHNYALIYLNTGIDLADPRRLPPKQKRLPNGSIKAIPQAWTDETYLNWVKINSSESTPDVKEEELQEIFEAHKDRVLAYMSKKSAPDFQDSLQRVIDKLRSLLNDTNELLSFVRENKEQLSALYILLDVVTQDDEEEIEASIYYFFQNN